MFIWWGPEKLQFYNDAYLQILGRDENSKHPKALGQKGEECWQEVWPVIHPLLQKVLLTGEPVYLEDQLIPIYRKGKLDEVYWTFSYNVIRNTNGEPGGILVVCSETTQKVKFQQDITASYQKQQVLNEEITAINEELTASNEELNQTKEDLRELNVALEHRIGERTKELSASENRFRSLIENSSATMLVFRGDELIFEMVNEAMLQILDKGTDIIGKPLLMGLPEVKGQPIVDIIYNVYRTGIPFTSDEIRVELNRNGKMEAAYFNLSYRPLYNGSEITGIVEAAIEVTKQVKASEQIQLLNEELTVINEELAAINEELTATNEGLLESQLKLQATVEQVKLSEGRFQNLVRDATVGIIVLTGEEMTVGIVNEAYGRMIGQSAENLLGRPLFSIIPDAEPDFRPIIDKVRLTGEPVYLYDTPYTVYNKGEAISGYLNLVYQPYRENDQSISGTIVLCHDVTEQVNARRKVGQAEENLRMAVESAELGTWSIENNLSTFTASPRFKQIFGFDPDEELTYNNTIARIDSSYREVVQQAAQASLKTGKPFIAEFPLIWANDGGVRWVRSIGKVNTNPEDKSVSFTGIVHDITEQKLDEQRKNDFISMVSHELKTPLTSIQGYLQVLLNKFKKTDDAPTISILSKTNVQLGKMTTMINGFLNVSRLEAGKIHINRQRFNMALLIRETQEECLATITSHPILFAPVEETFVNADRDKVGHVINNLISNAVKYSPAGSTIQIACKTIGSNTQVSVLDKGIGISHSDQEKLFDRYYRVANNNTIAGFGIGLYLCSEIIKRHEGKIWVESEIGKGSAFYFTLPLD